MKLWVDDIRPAPEGYILCRSTNEALRLIVANIDKIKTINLDHDMGDTFGGDAINILTELERKSYRDENFKQEVDKITFKLHSMNPVGVENMRAIIQKKMDGLRYKLNVQNNICSYHDVLNIRYL
jgi:hypothetical protein